MLFSFTTINEHIYWAFSDISRIIVLTSKNEENRGKTPKILVKKPLFDQKTTRKTNFCFKFIVCLSFTSQNV